MERESNSMQALCRSGCGFYGNPSTDGLCSLCYKEALKKKQQPPGSTPSPSSQSSAPPSSCKTALPTIPVIAQNSLESKDCEGEAVGGLAGCSAEAAVADSPDLTSDKQDDKDPKKKKNRCAVCRKKVGLTGFDCRCGGLYCAAHRYSDKHNCTFNYRELGAQEIWRNNPVVVAEKVPKI